MLCMLFLITLQQSESLPSERNSELGIRGWGWTTCLQSLLKALGLAPGGCAKGHRFCFHLIHQPCSEQQCWWARGIPQLDMDLLGVLSGFRAEEQLPGREGVKGSSGEAPGFTFSIYSGVCLCSGFWTLFLSLFGVCFALGFRPLW